MTELGGGKGQASQAAVDPKSRDALGAQSEGEGDASMLRVGGEENPT